MKKKSILLLTILLIAMFLTGCSESIVTPATDEVKIKGAIQDYFMAINDQNWSKAKNCCVNGSDMYYFTCTLQDAVQTLYQYASIVTITCMVKVSNISIEGSYGSAYISGVIIMTADNYTETESISRNCYLQKVGNSWKIYTI